MKIITLIENTSCDESILHAHGLSVYLETPQHKLLFDTGPNAKFRDNAERLGVDLAAVDVAVLSHGHYDHGGGLRAFCEANSGAKIYLHRGAFGDYYSAPPGKEPHYIGLDQTLREFQGRFVFTEGTTRIDRELTLFDDVPDRFSSMAASGSMKERTADGFRVDEFHHEQDLLVTAQGKTVVLAGCAHRGIVNIRQAATKLLGREPDVVIGGFHLFELEPGAPRTDELIDRTGQALLEGKTVYYTGHCTGDYAYQRLSGILGDRLHRISGGRAIDL